MTHAAHHGDDLSINFSQRGIAYFPDHALFVTVHSNCGEAEAHRRWQSVVKSTEKLCAETGYQTVCIRGVEFDLWRRWCKAGGERAPTGFTPHDGLDKPPFAKTGGQFWFHIKSDSAASCRRVFDHIVAELAPITERYIHTVAGKRHGGKVIGGRFTDAMINPVDPVNLSQRVIVGLEDAPYRGSAYVIQQKFFHNWARLTNMNAIEKEDMIGRNLDDTIIPMRNDRSHIKCVRQLDGERVTLRILRQAVSFGESPSGKGNEEGVYFVAYAKDTAVYHDLIHGIQGDNDGFVRDALLSNTHAESGDFWFVPSAEKAGVPPDKGDVNVPLNSFYDVRSANGWMYYNNRDFLHQIREGANPLGISDRIAILLGQTFSAWNDTWEKRVHMPSLGHLRDYLKKDEWRKIEKASTALSKGLAIKISLSDVLLRQEFRDSANLYTIKPAEIGDVPADVEIVRQALPTLSR